MPEVALITGRSRPVGVPEDGDAAVLAEALRAAGAQVHLRGWQDPEDRSQPDAIVVLTPEVDEACRYDFVAWAVTAGRSAAVYNEPDVLRWGTHRSYLLELEERGAPVVPTAWTGRGDTIELFRLLASRGWSGAQVLPAVGAAATARAALIGGDGVEQFATQDHLDVLLAEGDVLIREAAAPSASGIAVAVIDGQVSHLLGRGDLPTRASSAPDDVAAPSSIGGSASGALDGQEAAALARWVVDALGTPVLFARVDLVADEVGTLQIAEVAVTDAPLGLAVAGEGLGRLVRAILRGASARPASGPSANLGT